MQNMDVFVAFGYFIMHVNQTPKFSLRELWLLFAVLVTNKFLFKGLNGGGFWINNLGSDPTINLPSTTGWFFVFFSDWIFLAFGRKVPFCYCLFCVLSSSGWYFMPLSWLNLAEIKEQEIVLHWMLHTAGIYRKVFYHFSCIKILWCW